MTYNIIATAYCDHYWLATTNSLISNYSSPAFKATPSKCPICKPSNYNCYCIPEANGYICTYDSSFV